MKQRIELKHHQDKDRSKHRMLDKSSSLEVKEVEDKLTELDGSQTKAVSIAKELRSNDRSTRELFKQMLHSRIDEQRQNALNRNSMHDVRIKGEPQLRDLLTGCRQLQGGQQSRDDSSNDHSAHGGRHCAKGGKQKGIGKGQLKGGGPASGAIAILLANRPM